MKIHTDSPQVCDICHKLKPTRTALNHHKRLVHGDASFHCTICEKTFKRQLSLTVCIIWYEVSGFFCFFSELFSIFSMCHWNRNTSHRILVKICTHVHIAPKCSNLIQICINIESKFISINGQRTEYQKRMRFLWIHKVYTFKSFSIDLIKIA